MPSHTHRFVCPLCSLPLASIDAVWSHLNNGHTWNDGQFPPPPAFTDRSTPLHGRFHPHSAYIYGKTQNTLERLAAESSQHDEGITQAHQKNIYYPFSDRSEWELAKFLCENLNQGQITRFLKLDWVSDNYILPTLLRSDPD